MSEFTYNEYIDKHGLGEDLIKAGDNSSMSTKEWLIASLKLYLGIALFFGIICFLVVFFDTGLKIDSEWQPLFHCSRCCY